MFFAAVSGSSTPGSNGHGAEDAPTKENPAPGAGSFGLAIFLASLGMLFAGTVVAYIVVRMRSGPWPPPGLPPLPPGLGVSTGFLLAADLALELAARSFRPFRPARLKGLLFAALLLSFSFLASQTVAWVRFTHATPVMSLYGWLFFFVTGLHAAHVLGGLVPLVILTVNAWHDRVPIGQAGGVRACATYWHFLGVVWIGVYAMLALST